MPEKGEYVISKYFDGKIKSWFMIYPDFENMLVPEHNKKQNPDKSYTSE